MKSLIVKSSLSDEDNIKQLLTICFGREVSCGNEPYENLVGRYWVCYVDQKLVAMSGITSESDYGHKEVDWTCTHPDYRHKGYMQMLFARMLKGVEDDVYCSCWRVSDKVNLQSLMTMFGFENVLSPRLHYKVPYNCHCESEDYCPYYKGEACECFEDLYLRRIHDYSIGSVLKRKYVFWDVDGVLAPYRFNNHVGDPNGTDNGMSLKEIEDGVFLTREPIKKVQSIINCCDASENIVLGHYQVEKEMKDKQVWLDRYYSSLTERLFIPETESKADTIIEYCKEHNIDLKDVVFIDDTLGFLREAERKGILSYHISSLIDWN